MHLQRRGNSWMDAITGEILDDNQASLIVKGELLGKTARDLELAKSAYAQCKMEVDALIAERFPQFAGLSQAVINLQYDYDLQVQALREAVLASHAVTGTTKFLDGAVIVSTTERTTHFDEKQALDYADEMGLTDFIKRTPVKAKFETLAKSKAKTSDPLPSEVIKRELVAETRIYTDKIITLGE